MIPEKDTEFSETGIEGNSIFFDGDVPGDQLDVRDFYPGTEVSLVAQDGIAHITEVRHLATVEKKDIFEFAGVPDDAIISDDHILADIGAVPDLAIATDNGRPLDHGSMLYDGSLTDKDVFPYEGFADGCVMQGGAESEGDVGANFLQGIPGVFAAFENEGVFRLG